VRQLKGIAVSAVLMAAFAAVSTPPAAASVALSTKAGCMACHAVDQKKLGPSYKEVAARYKGDAKAPALLQQRIRQGSKGVWGKAPMLPTPPAKASDAELATLVAWILKQ
jgi:cytochrome c